MDTDQPADDDKQTAAKPVVKKKKPYTKPRIVYSQQLEAMATTCATPGVGKGTPGMCMTLFS